MRPGRPRTIASSRASTSTKASATTISSRVTGRLRRRRRSQPRPRRQWPPKKAGRKNSVHTSWSRTGRNRSPDGPRRRETRRLDLGIGRRGVCRDARSDLDRAARRTAAAARRQAVDTVRHATPSRGNATGNDDGLSATCEPAETRMGAPLSPRRSSSSIANGKMVQWWKRPRQDLRQALRARTAQDQDEPVRSREACLDHRRPAARDLQVHL